MKKRKESEHREPSPHVRVRIWPVLLAALLLVTVWGLNQAMKVVHYELPAEGVGQPIRIALVDDLHSCAYGEDQRELLEAIQREAPDLILMGGDLFDDQLPNDNTAAFLRGVSGRYPCYYVTGNHEYWSGEAAFAEEMAILEQYGITRLSGERVTLEIKGTKIDLCGVDDPCAWADNGYAIEKKDHSFREQVARLAGLPKEGRYTILLTHRPELFDFYSQYDFDLVLAGHAHGGQWRVPGILNGLYAPNQGLFPAYAGGEYRQNGTVMIVSRGLGRESTPIPRFYNRPELVMIDLITE